MTARDAKAERDLAADLRKIADEPRVHIFPMRFRALLDRGLVAWAEAPRPTRPTGQRMRAPAPRLKRLTDKGRLTLALLERQASERRAIAGATAARHATRDGAL